MRRVGRGAVGLVEAGPAVFCPLKAACIGKSIGREVIHINGSDGGDGSKYALNQQAAPLVRKS